MRFISLILPLLAILILSNKTALPGDALYRKNCKVCHGSDGTKGLLGAKNLKVSSLEVTAIVQQIREGKGPMPSFKKKFSEEELIVLADYVKNLRQP